MTRKYLPLRALLLLALTTAMAAPRADARPSDHTPDPVIGGPCEGCEHAYRGMPAGLTSTARIAPAESGEPMEVSGRVLTTDGNPAGGIIVYAYQTDAGGIYPDGETRHGSLRAWVKTDADGRYTFHTIRPGSYPGTRIPQHIHMHVIEPGDATYYIDDINFTDDPFVSGSYVDRRRQRGGSGVVTPRKDDRGIWIVKRDIVLRMNITN